MSGRCLFNPNLDHVIIFFELLEDKWQVCLLIEEVHQFDEFKDLGLEDDSEFEECLYGIFLGEVVVLGE